MQDTCLNTFHPTRENVKKLGRTYTYKDKVWCALSASGIEFSVNAKRCEVVVCTDYKPYDESGAGHYARIAIYVNDTLVIDDLVNEQEKRYIVFESKEASPSIVRVINVAEAMNAVIGVQEIITDADEMKPIKEKTIKIEYIGDSITCGYGVEGVLGELFSTSTENSTKAYAYMSAKELDADYSLVSFSGYGIVSGYTESGEINQNSLVPTFYEKLGNSLALFAGEVNPQDVLWDFEQYVPNIVVINLGTNDASYCGTNEERCKEYKDAYVEFLKVVRKKNPEATMVCVLGAMGDVLYPYIEQTVCEYRTKTGDLNVYVRHLEEQDYNTVGYGVDSHPNEISQKKTAKEMVNILKEIISIKEANQIGFQYEGIDTSWIDANKKLVAFAFDDGPVEWSEQSTGMKILKTLEKYGQHGTFFYIGKEINEKNQQEIEYAKKIGCEIGNHTWTHPFLTKLSTNQIQEELEKTRAKLSEITGIEKFIVRLPYLNYDEHVLQAMNVPGISCSVDSQDWNQGSYESVLQRMLDANEQDQLNGAIILMHEHYEFTAKAVEYLVPYLLEQGYQIVSVSELAAMKQAKIEAGKVYTNF